MALTSTMMPNPAFSPYSDSHLSTERFSDLYHSMQSPSGANDSLAPPPSPYPATVDPSPVESTNSTSTDATDIENDGAHEIHDVKSPDIELISPASHDAHLGAHNAVRLATDAATIAHAGLDDGPQSVIHIPSTFKQFTSSLPPTHEEYASHSRGSPPISEKSMSASMASSHTVQYNSMSHPPARDTAPINTQVPPTRSGAGSTPRASTQEEAEAEWKKSGSHRGKSNSPKPHNPELEEVPEVNVVAPLSPPTLSAEFEIDSLHDALAECWTLCKTLSKMGVNSRQRMFNFNRDSNEVQDKAWKSCWQLCQYLYDHRANNPTGLVKDVLDLTREFCQALFDARDKRDAVKDSILRVSFELNNHLFNTRNPELPDAFTERTLEFYVTLCHRLMKDRLALPEDIDNLVRSCWSLTECFFTFRESRVQKKAVDEETLGSAVQACWDLCDMFRERWSNNRPERGTPRPPQQKSQSQQRSYQMSSYSNSYGMNSGYSNTTVSRPESSLSLDRHSRLLQPAENFHRGLPPETPTTIQDERDLDDDPDHPPPAMLVYGNDTQLSFSSGRWPSSASNHSNYSDASSHNTRTGKSMSASGGQTSPKSVASSRTGAGGGSTTSSSTNVHLTCIKALVIRAALNKGLPRNSISTHSLQTFIRAQTAAGMFGTEPWQRQLFDQLKRLVLTDSFMQEQLPANRRFSALEIAYAVRWISKNDHYKWLQSLFESVFGFAPDAAEINSRGPALQI